MGKVLILGASGRTGRLVAPFLQGNAHQTVALVRPDSVGKVSFDKTIVVSGHCDQRDDLRRAMRGCVAVVNVLNNNRTSDFPFARSLNRPTFLADTMKIVLDVMQEEGVRRIVSVTAAGTNESFGEVGFLLQWLYTKTNVRIGYNDHNQQEMLLRASSLDWTIVRPMVLTNSKRLRLLRVTENGTPAPAFRIARRHVANFTAGAVDDDQWIGRAPVISET